MRVADYLMRAVAQAGVGHVFLLPGGGAMHLNDALARSSLAWVPCHHEQACGIAAEAYGRIRENLGVAMVTTGPGATNILTPVAGAWIESSPLLVISGQVKRPDRLRDRPLRQGGVQEVDIVKMAGPVTKYAVTVEDPLQVRYHMEKALHLARSGRQGPVWLDIPLDVQAALIDPDALEGFTPPPPSASGRLEGFVGQVAELLRQARRPLLLAGHGVRLSGCAGRFPGLSERLGLPVAATWNAMDLLPFDHPLAVGRPGVVAMRAANFAVQNCDLLLSVGCRLDNILTAYAPRNFARGARKVVVDVDPNEIAKLDMDLDLAIEADASAFLEALAAQAPPGAAEWAPWIERCQAWKRRYPLQDGLPFATDGPISHYHFMDALSEALPGNTLIATGSSGLAVEVFYTVFRNKPGQRIFLTSGLGAMGYGLPAAIGACLAQDRKPMVAIESDGSLQLNLQELATLKAQDLPICLFIMNNNGYASIRNTQRNYFQGKFIATGPESGLLVPDTLRLAEALGIPAMRIERPGDLVPGLREALGKTRPFICEVMLKADEALMPKVSALPQPDGSMLSMPLEDMSPLLPLERLREDMIVPLLEASLRARS